MISEKKDKKFISLHADPGAWKVSLPPLCQSCLNCFKDEFGAELCDVRCINPEEMTAAKIDDVRQTGECEFYIKNE